MLGNPPDMDRLMDIVNRYELIFLEDACDALGSTWKGKPLGSFGLITGLGFTMGWPVDQPAIFYLPALQEWIYLVPNLAGSRAILIGSI